mgnify:CR=1 FL=1
MLVLVRGMLLVSLFITSYAIAQKRVFNIYHDSDYSNHSESANAMKMGFLTALSQYENELNNIEFNFIEKDHRGNSNRSLLHMKQFLSDPNALFILGGLHSPPYIRYKQFISENEVLLLVPWAAGGPITRHAAPKNWVFRVSVDDTKAGYRIVSFARDQLRCEQPHMLLEQTPWGKSNHTTMRKALGNVNEGAVTWFSWNTKLNQAKIMLRDITATGAQCVLFVGNAVEGKQFVDAMAALPSEQRVPIVSHWGITGGDFFNQVKQHLANDVKLNFIQTCLAIEPENQSPLAKQASVTATKLFPNTFTGLENLSAPAGFVHSFDLANIFLTAFANVKPKGNISDIRLSLRNELERIKKPIEGLIKTYQHPFSQWSPTQPDAHEALGLENLCMAEYKANGGIRVFNNKEH